MTVDSRWTEKIAIVTGAAAGGIGEAYAAALADAGAMVVCADIDAARPDSRPACCSVTRRRSTECAWNSSTKADAPMLDAGLAGRPLRAVANGICS